jgi:hypothetical protein
MAPATESIMGSLPLAKAGVGSAMNDTTRMIGGALGVAVLGSILASSYGSAIRPALNGFPEPVAAAASDSIGATASVAAQLGPQGEALLAAARSAYMEGMGDAILLGAAVAALGALVVLLFLPARARHHLTGQAARPASPVGIEPAPHGPTATLPAGPQGEGYETAHRSRRHRIRPVGAASRH